MRLAIAYLKTRSLMNSSKILCQKSKIKKKIKNHGLIKHVYFLVPGSLMKPDSAFEKDDIFLKALDGFVIILSSDGDIVYLSQNVSDYLGISQVNHLNCFLITIKLKQANYKSCSIRFSFRLHFLNSRYFYF